MIDALTAALEQAKQINPKQSAHNCGFKYVGSETNGEFEFCFLNKKVKLLFPSFKGYFTESNKEIKEFILSIVLYHLAKSTGAALSGKWISYADMPGGLSYIAAFRGYTSKKLIKYFKNDLKSLTTSANSLGLKRIDLGADAAFLFEVMPKIRVAFLYRLGDEEFEPTADFLFDESAPRHLPGDCYTVMCSLFTSSLISKTWKI